LYFRLRRPRVRPSLCQVPSRKFDGPAAHAFSVGSDELEICPYSLPLFATRLFFPPSSKIK
jgi:hypothetical protein